MSKTRKAVIDWSVTALIMIGSFAALMIGIIVVAAGAAWIFEGLSWLFPDSAK